MPCFGIIKEIRIRLLFPENYHFDQGWAKDDPECMTRIERYEAGDSTAQGIQELVIEEVEKEDEVRQE